MKKRVSRGEIIDMQCIVPILVIKKPHLFRSSTSKQQLRRKAQGSRRKAKFLILLTTVLARARLN